MKMDRFIWQVPWVDCRAPRIATTGELSEQAGYVVKVCRMPRFYQGTPIRTQEAAWTSNYVTSRRSIRCTGHNQESMPVMMVLAVRRRRTLDEMAKRNTQDSVLLLALIC